MYNCSFIKEWPGARSAGPRNQACWLDVDSVLGTKILFASQTHSKIIGIAFKKTKASSPININEQTLARIKVDDPSLLDSVLIHCIVIFGSILRPNEWWFAFGQLAEQVSVADNHLEIWDCSHISLSNLCSAPLLGKRKGIAH